MNVRRPLTWQKTVNACWTGFFLKEFMHNQSKLVSLSSMEETLQLLEESCPLLPLIRKEMPP